MDQTMTARSASSLCFSAKTFPYLHKNGEYAQKLNQTKGLAQNIASINRDDLGDEYKRLMGYAPRRSDRDKRYFVGHDGVPSGSRGSNLYEEHLAMALWNCKERWPHPNGSLFCLLDYQFPLKARQSDKGIGKVDLLGLTDQGRLMVIEMKVRPLGDNNRGETPAAAMLQGLRYAAIMQANQEAIADEAKHRFNIRISTDPPIVQVLAPKDWWQDWLDLGKSTRRAAGYWEPEFIKLSKDIEQQIGIPIECLEIETNRSALTFGGDGQPPRLNHTPGFTYPSFWR